MHNVTGTRGPQALDAGPGRAASDDELSAAAAERRSRHWYGFAWFVFFVSVVAMPLDAAVFSASLYFIAAFALMRANLQSFFVVLLIVVRFAVVVVSITSIELGAYITEQFRYGFNNGSTASYVPYLILFLMVFHIGTTKLSRRFIGQIDLAGAPLRRCFWLVLLGYGAINLIFIGTIALYGTAASIGGDRFVYWEHLPNQVRSLVMFVRSWGLSSFAVLLGFITRYAPKPSVVLLVLYVFTFIELFLMGEKFAALFNNFFLFLIGFALAAIVTGKHIKLRFSTLFGAVIIFLGLYFALDVGYQQLSGGRADSVDSIMDRITLEAHVWFGILDVGEGKPFVSFHDMWKQNSLETPSGLDYLSYLITSPEYVHQRLSGGIPFTMGGGPAVLAVFGRIGGLLVFGFEGFLYPLVGFLFLTFLRARLVVIAGISLIGYNLVMLTAVMGYWDVYHSRVAKCLLLAMLGGLLLVAVQNRRFRKRSHPPAPVPGPVQGGSSALLD